MSGRDRWPWPRPAFRAGRPFQALALAAVVSGCGGPEARAAPAPAPPQRVTVVQDPESTALAAAVVVPGSAWELPGTEGLTVFSAMALLEQIRPALEPLGARAGVTCGSATFTFTLLAARDVWRPALETFLDGLFRPAPTSEALTRARGRLAQSLALDRASPAWQARLAVRNALYGDSLSSGWLGPACGIPETLAYFDLADVRAGARRFAPGLAHMAALAPDSAGTVEALLRDRIPAGPRPLIPRPRTVAPTGRYVERNTVTAWLALAFPFGRGADVEAIRLLGTVVTDAIGPGVDRPEAFTASYDVDLHGAGGTLVIRAITTPESAAEYADRIEGVVSAVAGSGVAEAVYRRTARRHRGLRLQQMAAPEARAVAMALALALGLEPVPWPEATISRQRLQAAAADLGTAARAVVGPRAARGAVEP